jgi:phosphotransferase system IIB component
MKLQIPPVSQRNPLWANKKLGTSTVSTIGNYGCLLTCHSMMLTYYGHEFHPDDLNEFYKTRKVFDQATLINYYKAADCFDDINADEFVDCYDSPAPLEKIDKYLIEGKPVIALVDFSPTAGVQTHFILIIGKENDYLINDPWTGETYFFTAKYGDPARFIFGLRLYSGPKQEVEENVASLNAKITELSNKLADEIKANAELRTTIVRLEGDFAEQDKQMQSLIEENRKALAEQQGAEKALMEKMVDYNNLEKKYQEVVKVLSETEKTIEQKIIDSILFKIGPFVIRIR